MKKITLFLILALISFSASETYADDYDFRKTKWGMSQKEVLASETLKVISQTAEGITCQNKVLNKEVLICYQFIQDKLYRTAYLLQEKYSDHFIEVFKDFQDALISKYGKPSEDKLKWKNESAKENYASYKRAILTGNLTYYNIWETYNTEITLMMCGHNQEIRCAVTYHSKEFKNLKEQKGNQQNMDDF